MGIQFLRIMPTGMEATVPVAEIDAYMVHRARNPDPGSWFDILTRWRNLLSDRSLLRVLSWLWYGGQLYVVDGKIVNHIFYHDHWRSIHLFAIQTREDYQRRGIAKRMLRDWLIEVYYNTKVGKVRISAGRDPVVAKMVDDILAGKYDLPFLVEPGHGPGWIKLIR